MHVAPIAEYASTRKEENSFQGFEERDVRTSLHDNHVDQVKTVCNVLILKVENKENTFYITATSYTFNLPLI